MTGYPMDFCKDCIPEGKEGTLYRDGICNVCSKKGLVANRNELKNKTDSVEVYMPKSMLEQMKKDKDK